MSLEAAMVELASALKENTAAHQQLTAVAKAAVKGGTASADASAGSEAPRVARAVLKTDAKVKKPRTSLLPVGSQGYLRDRSWNWHLKNPHIFEAFERLAMLVIAEGHKKFSAQTIIARVMWERSPEEDHIRNAKDMAALYARVFMHLHPEHAGFFETRGTNCSVLPIGPMPDGAGHPP